jgi:hypothetical protein
MMVWRLASARKFLPVKMKTTTITRRKKTAQFRPKIAMAEDRLEKGAGARELSAIRFFLALLMSVSYASDFAQ